MMGIGQVVTLRVPADKLREVNRAIENTAWGGYRTEFYPTYDYKAVAEQMREQKQQITASKTRLGTHTKKPAPVARCGFFL